MESEWIGKPTPPMDPPGHLVILDGIKTAGCTCVQGACNHVIWVVNEQFDPCGRRTKLLGTVETVLYRLV